MTADMKTALFSTVYDEKNEKRSSSRAAWEFCGRRVCMARLCNLLHMTPRTCYKKIRGEIDRRKFNSFMLELYHTTAEFLPEPADYHVSDVELAAHEKLTGSVFR